jgi:putative ATPase
VEACASAFERIGLPEGLYPLAQAALYLACTDKSNSTIGIFEAISSVRRAQRQDVPSHLRDANRDGDAFGDGQGYRYPHAFREHWVAQQYLPTALQGEAFWTPGRQGWEGARRDRLLERRAAQLAAAAEALDDHPLLVSSGPDLPQLERWLQRQLAQDGERLQELRRRLWADLRWQRTDRVLLVGGRSLLWALDPLSAACDGGVSILCGSPSDHNRLQAQVQWLDPLQQPVLLEGLPALSHLDPEQRFEIIGGRFHQQDLAPADLEERWASISSRASADAQLRLLISTPELGPIAALLQLDPLKGLTGSERQQLEALQALESAWLSNDQAMEPLQTTLEQIGWCLRRERWHETLSLPLDQALIDRWLGEGRPYRCRLEASGTEAAGCIPWLRRQFEAHRGRGLPQRLCHQRLIGQQQKAPAMPGPKA